MTGIIDSDDLDRFADDKRKREMKEQPIAGITPMKTLMPVIPNSNTDNLLKINKKLNEIHDDVQVLIAGSRERALLLTKLEEAHHWLTACGAK